MCLAGIALLAEAWNEGGARVGRLEDGDVVTLAFVPDAEPGDHLLVQLGIPVEVVEPEDAEPEHGLRTASPERGGHR